MTPDFAQVLGAAYGVVLILTFVGAVVLAFFLPYMAWSVTRNVKRARLALEQIAELLDARLYSK